ncbi:MAG TPA: isoamylase early set domain-containing protein [Gemmatimonadaceae bacterium]|nr:isoamylase early set domain-containing protein [Gemmatimonadaceae bacterium]
MTDELNSLDPYVRELVGEARRPVVVDPSARHRLMEAIRLEPAPRRRSRVLDWLLEPRHSSLSPVASMALAAGLVGIGILGGLAIHRDGRLSTEQAPPVGVGNPHLPDSGTARAIRFVLIAPQAARVSVVGDFNDWDPSANPMSAQREPGSSGVWSVYVPLQPGLHTYSFVVDGTHFVPDPAAPIAPDDGYGHRSSVVIVRGSSL